MLHRCTCIPRFEGIRQLQFPSQIKADFFVDNISITCSANQVISFGHGQQQMLCCTHKHTHSAIQAEQQNGYRIKINSAQRSSNCNLQYVSLAK